MVRQCFLADTGITSNGKLLARIGLDPGTLYPPVLRGPDPITLESVPLSNCDRRDGDGRKQGNDLRGGRRGSSGRSVRTLTVQVLLATRNPTLKTEIPEERWSLALTDEARPQGVSLLRLPFEA